MAVKILAFFTSLTLLLALATGCQSNIQPRNSELVVEYFGKKIKHEKPRWTNHARLMNVLKKSEKKFLIFGADWCGACAQLRIALKDAQFTQHVEYLNADVPWVASLMRSYQITGIPFMIELDKNNVIQTGKVGPSAIVLHLLVHIENSN